MQRTTLRTLLKPAASNAEDPAREGTADRAALTILS
jgi:hypothetical protein